jgi:hypothetical protein
MVSPPSSPNPSWAYAYELTPPQTAERLQAVQLLLDDALSAARRDARTWAGTVVVEERVTHILVVSDTPEQDREGNRRLESALTELGAGFSMSMPVALP